MSDGDRWEVLEVRHQGTGVSYVIHPEDGIPFTAESIKIAGVHIGIEQRAEIECQRWAVDDHVLFIDGVDPWEFNEELEETDPFSPPEADPA